MIRGTCRSLLKKSCCSEVVRGLERDVEIVNEKVLGEGKTNSFVDVIDDNLVSLEHAP